MSSHVFAASMLAGGAGVAAWAYVRFPRARPKSLASTVGHVVVSLLLLTFAPVLVHLGLVALPPPLSVVLAVAGVTAPVLSYILLSWVWLVAYILDAGASGPRGGDPIASNGR